MKLVHRTFQVNHHLVAGETEYTTILPSNFTLKGLPKFTTSNRTVIKIGDQIVEDKRGNSANPEELCTIWFVTSIVKTTLTAEATGVSFFLEDVDALTSEVEDNLEYGLGYNSDSLSIQTPAIPSVKIADRIHEAVHLAIVRGLCN